MVPKPCGIPGCIATLRKVIVPSRPSVSLTTSCQAAHADPAAGHQEVGPEQLILDRGQHLQRVVGDGTVAEGQAAGLPCRRGEHEAVGVPDLAGGERADLARPARRRSRRPRPGAAGRPRPGRARRRPARRSAWDRAGCRGGSSTSPRRASPPLNRTAWPGSTAVRIVTRATPPSVSSTGTTASAPPGSMAPVVMMQGAAGRDRVGPGVPGRHLAADPQGDRACPSTRPPRRWRSVRTHPWPSCRTAGAGGSR